MRLGHPTQKVTKVTGQGTYQGHSCNFSSHAVHCTINRFLLPNTSRLSRLIWTHLPSILIYNPGATFGSINKEYRKLHCSFWFFHQALLLGSLLANLGWIAACQTATVLPTIPLHLWYTAHTSCSNRIQHEKIKLFCLFSPTVLKSYICSCQGPFFMLEIQGNLHLPPQTHMHLFIML